ncbi:sugar phosphate isomerase/epimerase [Thermogutta sp.]|uniref:sugar phosphate isomerase/epimerase family protein n=1 Tax=Thermogutta sp. TaxID=1962930 RepID=UPI0025D2DABB|nr:sugar phosphate isomerase/epimerase [Thermogutta sp.]
MRRPQPSHATQSAPRRQNRLPRRDFLKMGVPVLAAAGWVPPRLLPAETSAAAPSARFSLRYLLATCLYGYAPLEQILPEVRKAGAEAIDLWPKVHGNQREQLDTLGPERFQELLTQHGVRLGAISRYDLGPFQLADEIRLAGRLGCPVIVTGARGPVGLKNAELRQAVRDFVEKLKPTLALAEECGVILAIENHGNSLIDSPDAMRWLAESWPTRTLSLAFAPYHLPQDADLLARLIRDLDEKIAVFYMWQHGKGCMKPMPLEDELLQLPGKGPLDFRPILAALRDIHYSGYSSIFMHAYPRGRPIRETPALVTAQILEAREYLERCLAELD